MYDAPSNDGFATVKIDRDVVEGIREAEVIVEEESDSGKGKKEAA